MSYMNKCLNCGKEVKNKYCNSKCRNKHNPTKYIPTLEAIEKQKLVIKNRWKTFNVVCSRCGKSFQIREFNVNNPKKENYYCSRSCSNFRLHNNHTKNKIKQSLINYYKDHSLPFKNDGQPKNKKVCPICDKEFYVPNCENHRIYCSKKCYNEDKHCKYRKNASGGYRRGAGRGKSGWYKEYWCDSSYELAYTIYNIEHDIIFRRNTESFDYIWKNKTYKYFPDYIVENEYVEIKGYETDKDRSKYISVNKPIKILKTKDLKYALDYAIDKYGKDYIRLYTNNPHNDLTNTCKVCGKACKKKSTYCSRKCSGMGNNKYSKWKT